MCNSCKAECLSKLEATEKKRLERELIDGIVLTTESAHNLNVVKRLGVITSEAVIGSSMIKDMFIGVRDVVGGRSDTLQKTLKETRNIVLNELKVECAEMGGDAVVAIDLDYGEISSNGTMLMLVASGTVVKID